MKKAAAIAAYWPGAASSKGEKPAQCRCVRPSAGLVLKTLFTICARRRYGRAMLIFAAALLAATPPAPERVVPVRQARAMVTITAGAKLRFTELEKTAPELFRKSSVRSPDGAPEAARLIEFQ